MAPSVEDTEWYQVFNNYISDVVKILDGDSATIDDSSNCIRDFSSNHDPDTLLITKEKLHNQYRIYNATAPIKPIINAIESIIFVIKSKGVLVMDEPLGSQLNIISIPVSSDTSTNDLSIDALRDALDLGLFPYYDLVSSERGSNLTRKRFIELSLALQTTRSIQIPNLVTTTHPKIRSIISGDVEMSQDLLDDIAFINELTAVSNDWIHQILSITKISHSTMDSKSIRDEIQFWNTVEIALTSIGKQIKSPEVATTLDVLSKARKFHITLSFENDIGLKEMTATASSYRAFFKDIPLDELLVDEVADYDSFNNGVYDVLSYVNQKLSLLPIPAEIDIIQLLLKDVCRKLQDLISKHEIMSLEYTSFRKHQAIVTKSINAINDKLKATTTVLREIARKRQEKIKLISIDKSELDSISFKLKLLTAFRTNHESLMHSVENALSADERSRCVKDLIEAYNKYIIPIDVADISHEGKLVWSMHEGAYKKVFNTIFTSVVTRINGFFNNAEQFADYLSIYYQFFPNLDSSNDNNASFMTIKDNQKLKILDCAMLEIQSLKEDINTCTLNDYKKILYDKGLISKLNFYRESLSKLLGVDWKNFSVGSKIDTLTNNLITTLDPKKAYADWVSNEKAMHPRDMGVLLKRPKHGDGCYALKLNLDMQKLQLYESGVVLKNLGLSTSNTLNHRKQAAFCQIAIEIENVIDMLNRVFDVTNGQLKTQIFEFISGDVYKLIPLVKQLSRLEWNHLWQAIELVNQNDALLMRSESLVEMQALNCLQQVTQLLMHINAQVNKIQNFFIFVEQCIFKLKTAYFEAAQFLEVLDKLQHKLDETLLDGLTSDEKLRCLVRHKVESCLYGRLCDQLTLLCNAMVSHDWNESINRENYVTQFPSYLHTLTFSEGVIVLNPSLKEGRNHYFQEVHLFVAIVSNRGDNLNWRHSSRTADLTKHVSARNTLNLVTGRIDAIYNDIENYVSKWKTIQTLLDVSLDEDKEWIFVGDELKNWYQTLRDVCELGKVFDESRVAFGGLISVDAHHILAKLFVLYEPFKKRLFSEFSDKFSQIVQALEESVRVAQSGLNKRLDFSLEAHQLVFDLGDIAKVKKETYEWEKSIVLFDTIERFLSRYRFKFPTNWLYIAQLETDFAKVQALLKDKELLVKNNEDQVLSIVQRESLETSRQLQDLTNDWTKARPTDGDLRPAVALQCLSEYQHKFKTLCSFGMLLNEVASNLKMEPPFIKDVLEIMDDIVHLKEVWSSVNTLWEDLQQMKHTPWASVSVHNVSLKLRAALNSIKELPFSVRQYSAVDELKQEIKKYLKLQPKVLQISNSFLKDRHWKKILEQLCPSVKAANTTLGTIWQLNLDLNFQLIQDVLDQARDEQTIEESIGKIEETWSGIYFELFNYENRCRLVKNWDALYDQCEANLDVINSIKKSLYGDTFEKSVTEWELKLNTLHAILDVWVEVQRDFIHLDGVLGKDSNEVRNLLPLEHTRFQNLGYEFMSLLKQIYKYNQVIDIILIGDIQGQMNRFSSSLKRIQKSLTEYLEKQRDLFPRFFFLGDEDLLEVIGFSKNVTRINRHLKKMFGGVARINFDDDSHSIVSVASEEGEILQLRKRVSLVKHPMLHEWLLELELQVQQSLKHQLHTNFEPWSVFIKSGEQEELIKLLNRTTSQISNLLVQIVFTQWIESLIQSDMLVVGSRIRQLIQSFVSLLETCQDEILRKKTQNIIIELLHQRQLTGTLQDAITESRASLWDVQQRFYYDEKTSEVIIKQAFSTFNYGFEYLGIPEKLAYSPLLNSCFLNMTQALSMKLGGSPVGPSGTGKTESVKALGQNLGKMVVVFCCDEQFDYLSMGRIFRGLCKVGAWGCFDEFNRLDEASLSAVSSQIESIQYGLQHPLVLIELSNRVVHVNPESAVFVTMNPGYAGRNELPVNLKKLFRTFQMNKPDVQLIIEVLLTSMTFASAHELSILVTQFFTEIARKVSSQKHYSFGLRAVKTTLGLCGKLKYRDGDKSEHESLREFEIVKRSIYETVLPKLTFNDVQEFTLLQDRCFPGITIPLGTAGLKREVERICHEQGYQTSLGAVEKALQLASIQSSHHGIMLVGESGSGKSTVLNLTMKALTIFESVEHTSVVISPKVFSKEHLYGKFDALTKQWTDGLFTSVLRRIQENARGELEKRTWIVFDGDVDPIWAENLNSVLDDNRVLTLPTGERLVLPSSVSIVFETTNLDNATPATISRCGMVWFDKSLVTNDDIYSRILFKLTHHDIRLDDDGVQNDMHLASLTKELIGAVISIMTPNLIERLDSESRQLEHIMKYTLERAVNTFQVLVFSYVKSCLQCAIKVKTDLINSKVYAGKISILALIWAFAGDCSTEERFQFQKQIATFGDLAFVDFPDGDILDYEIGYPEAQWVPIASKVETLNLQPQEITNPNILVPTVDTLKHENLIYGMIQEHRTLILCGPPGSGKTMTLFKALSKSSQYDILALNFSKESTPQSLLNSMENFCVYKRVNGGVSLCPKTNGKWVVVFCDEINLPGLDRFGTQTVISLIRQMIEHNGFWRPKDLQWVSLQNIQFVGACNSPKDPGRYELSPSFLRHVCLVQVNSPGKSSLLQIYQTLNNAIFKCAPNLKPFVSQITRASIDIYEKSKSKLVLYVYSPRELTRWSRGLFEAIKSIEYRDLSQFLRLWYNEGLRLFYDRLSMEEDKFWTLDLFRKVCDLHFPNVDSSSCFQAPVFFSDWLNSKYQSVNSHELKRFTKERLRVYSEEEIETDLVLHDEMLDHVLRIDRVMKQPQGHAILVGPSSSGRMTLTRFVAWMNGIKVVQLSVKTGYTIDDFDDFLRHLLLRVVDGEKICLVIDESSIVEASFVERMNVLLANAEVPGLFEGENRATLISKCAEKSQLQGLFLDSESELSRWFTNQISQNLHVIFTIGESRVGKGREVLSSPALFNRCVLSWTGDWSNLCLRNIASSKLNNIVLDSFTIKPSDDDLDIAEGGCTGHKDLIIDYLIYVHRNMCHLNFTHEHNYPAKFLTLIDTFMTLCSQKRAEADERQRHIVVGLEKLQQTVLQVEKMKLFLASKEKELMQKNQEARQMLNQMLGDQNEAERKQEFSIETQRELEKQEELILSRRETVMKELALVEPAVLEAQRGVQNIKKQHLTEIRSMSNPPAAVKMTMESVCVLLGYHISNWRDVQLAVRGEDFIPNIVNFDCENQLSPELRDYMEQTYLSRPDFTFEIAHRASKACGPLLEWVRAQLAYSLILKEVGPLREEVNLLEQRTVKTKAHLIAIDQMIKELDAKIENCKSSYSELIRETEKIKMESSEVLQKLQRSITLVKNLENERVRWRDSSKSFDSTNECIVGTALLCASFVTYAGASDEKGRDILRRVWCKRLADLSIPYDSGVLIAGYLVKKSELRRWLENGLPDDELSKTNIALLSWIDHPILIDPSGAIVDVIAKSYPAKILTVAAFNNDAFYNTLENSLRFGGVLVLEDAEELNPIVNDLLRSTMHRNNGRMMVELAGKLVDFNPSFKLIMCTKELGLELTEFVRSRAGIINFSITSGSLENRVLDNALRVSHPKLEKQRAELILARSDITTQLQNLEDELLVSLNTKAENILEDDKLLGTLETLNKNSVDLSKRLENAKEVMSEVDSVREQFEAVASQCVAINLLVTVFQRLFQFYELSVSAFLELCVHVMNQNDLLDPEITALNVYRETFNVVSPALPYKDKIVLALLLMVLRNSFQMGDGYKEAIAQIMRHLLKHKSLEGSSMDSIVSGSKLTNSSIVGAKKETDGPSISALVEFAANPKTTPFDIFVHFCSPLFHVTPFESKYDTEYWLKSTQPILAVSPDGYDPTFKFVEVAEKYKRKVIVVSMGSKESADTANKALEKSQKEPVWIIVQNVQLATHWLEHLKLTISNLSQVSGSKLLLTCSSYSRLPRAIITKSRVLYFEKVVSFRKAVSESFAAIPTFLLSSPVDFHVFLLLSWFHGLVSELCRYIPFSFKSDFQVDDADFTCGINVIENAIYAAKGRVERIPWQEIRIMLGDVVYGGKISSKEDHKYLQNLCNRTFTSDSLKLNFDLIENEISSQTKEALHLPDSNTMEAYSSWLENLPDEVPLSWLGLEQNVKESLTTKSHEETIEEFLQLIDTV